MCGKQRYCNSKMQKIYNAKKITPYALRKFLLNPDQWTNFPNSQVGKRSFVDFMNKCYSTSNKMLYRDCMSLLIPGLVVNNEKKSNRHMYLTKETVEQIIIDYNIVKEGTFREHQLTQDNKHKDVIVTKENISKIHSVLGRLVKIVRNDRKSAYCNADVDKIRIHSWIVMYIVTVLSIRMDVKINITHYLDRDPHWRMDKTNVRRRGPEIDSWSIELSSFQKWKPLLLIKTKGPASARHLPKDILFYLYNLLY